MRLLYVDDDRINTLLFAETCRLLRELELECAASGVEALEVAARWRPDVFVIDLHLPDIDGCALLPRLRALPGAANRPAFLCTADDVAAVTAPAQAAGFDACWGKPVDLPAMLQALSGLHGSRQR